jgi:hypothetical protein
MASTEVVVVSVTEASWLVPLGNRRKSLGGDHAKATVQSMVAYTVFFQNHLTDLPQEVE